MKNTIFTLMIVIFLVLAGCTDKLASIPVNFSNTTPSSNLTSQEKIAVQLIPERTEKYNGSFPALKEVAYVTKSGQALVAPAAYPGFIYLFTSDSASDAHVTSAVNTLDGEVFSSLPDYGIYVIRVKEGGEAKFLSSIYSESWVLDGIPASYPVIGANWVSMYDFFDYGTGWAGDCGKKHGNLAQREAQRLGGSVEGVSLNTDIKDRGVVANKDIANSILERMKQAAADGDNIVFSLSIQSMESGIPLGKGGSVDLTGCKEQWCEAARNGQLQFYRIFLQMLDRQIKLDNKQGTHIADNALIAIIAGNLGVELDDQIKQLRNDYSDAFKQVVIVGGTDPTGEIANYFNHLVNNELPPDGQPNMVYSLANGVPIFGPDGKSLATCRGTSFAAPEVAAVLDYIWRHEPTLSAGEVMEVFDQTLKEMGKGNKLPQYNGMTDEEFLQKALDNAATKAGKTLLGFESIDFPEGQVGEKYDFITAPVGGKPPYKSVNYRVAVGQNDYERSTDGIEFSLSGGPVWIIKLDGIPTENSVGTRLFQFCVTDSTDKKVCKTANVTMFSMDVSFDSASCTRREGSDPENPEAFIIDATGIAKGPVGTYLILHYSSILGDCGVWGKNCMRDENEPASTNWHIQNNGYANRMYPLGADVAAAHRFDIFSSMNVTCGK